MRRTLAANLALLKGKVGQVRPLPSKISRLTVADLVGVPELQLELAAGAASSAREIAWIAITEIPDPGPWVEGNELLLTMGQGIGRKPAQQVEYVRRLHESGLAALGFGLGPRWETIPTALLREADALAFPVIAIPYELPFIAITKETFLRLANRQLALIEAAQEINADLMHTALSGPAGLAPLIRIASRELDSELTLIGDRGDLIVQSHTGSEPAPERSLDIPINVGESSAVLRVVNESGELNDYEKLVLNHTASVIAFELSRQRSVSGTELRLAGNLISDLEREALDQAEVLRRLSAFGLDPSRRFAALSLMEPGTSGARIRNAAHIELSRRSIVGISTAESDRATFLIEADSEADVRAAAEAMVVNHPGFRLGIGRPASGVQLGQSIREATAALEGSDRAIASYADLGSTGLLLSLPDEALLDYARTVLGPVLENEVLMTSITIYLGHGGRLVEASEAIGIHRHTMRNRIAKVGELAGRNLEEPADRIDVWLAIKACNALNVRRRRRAAMGERQAAAMYAATSKTSS